ncbi:membrane protein [Streptomyces avermitilis]|uniref:Membrane protein n=1 Tax=Streptomyces avermitilis TaxID=33903 RepID=A0A4D4MFY0_STRAX|nr:membrane protein [Streptomyces avermitilis]
MWHERRFSLHFGPPSGGFLAELRDAISFRAFGLVLGGLLIQLAFTVSYLGAFHSPTPHRIPVAVVAPEQASTRIVAKLNGLDGDPVKATAAAGESAARQRILDRNADAAFLFNATGTKDTLLVASAGGPSVSQTATQLAQKIEAAQKRQVTVTDIKAPNSGDGRGMTSFYLVLGWVVGGYLTATIINMSAGSRPANPHRIVIRLAVLGLYAIVSGVAGAVIVGPVFDALSGHFWALTGIGTLVVFASAATSLALQTLLGMLGTGLTILLFVVLGNPSSGGVYPSVLLPGFWSAIGQALPPGAGTTLVRNTVYFGAHATAAAWWVLAAYTVGGIAVALVAAWRRERRKTAAITAVGSDTRGPDAVPAG